MIDVKRPTLRQISMVFGLLLVLLGVMVGVYLVQISQDTRQQAAEQGIIDVQIRPNSTTFTSADPVSVDITVDSGPNVVTIEQLQFTLARITGDIPADLSFTLSPLPGVVTVSTSIVETADGRELRATLTNPSRSYSTNGQIVNLGTFRFTPPESGQLRITLDPSMSTAIRGVQGTETVRLGQSVTYGFTRPTPVPTATTQALPTLTQNATLSTPSPSPLLAQGASPSATVALRSVTPSASSTASTGSVTVCLVITQAGKVLSDWSGLSTEQMSIALYENPRVIGTSGEGRASSYGTLLQELAFSTKDLPSSSPALGVVGKCSPKVLVSYVANQQPATHITYRPLTRPTTSQFVSVAYHDQWSATTALSSATSYSAILFDGDTSNDTGRTFQSDGDVPISAARPDRTITIVLATLDTPHSPQALSLSQTSQTNDSTTLTSREQTSVNAVESTPSPTPLSFLADEDSAPTTPTPTSTALPNQQTAGLLAQGTSTPNNSPSVLRTTTVSDETDLQTENSSANSVAASTEEMPISGTTETTLLVLAVSLLLLGIGIFAL